MKHRGRNGDSEDMAWPKGESDDDSIEEKPDAEPVSTREAEKIVKKALENRQPHVVPRRAKIDDDDEEDDDIDDDETAEDTTDDEKPKPKPKQLSRRQLQREADPIFFLMVASAISIGLTPVDAMTRYVILWSILGGMGLVAYILGASQRLSQASMDDLTAGIGFGLGVGIPLVIVMGTPLESISQRMFDLDGVPSKVMDSWVYMAIIFVQPASDSLFFRGAMQQFRSLILTALLATAWNILLFFPHMELANVQGVAITIGLFFAFLNFLYGYVRFRNGLAAAWVCQIVGGGMLWFVPRLLF